MTMNEDSYQVALHAFAASYQGVSDLHDLDIRDLANALKGFEAGWAAGARRQKVCKHGHPMTDGHPNVYVYHRKDTGQTMRQCKACRHDRHVQQAADARAYRVSA